MDKKIKTTSGIDIKNCYFKEDAGSGPLSKEAPGAYPYTRGIHPKMYRERLWTMRQYAGFGKASETNERFKYLLEAGQTGLSVAFDLPTQIGLDSDDPLSRGEVGRVGVAIDSLKDMEMLFQGIPLDKVSTSMTINATAIILLAMYIALAEKRGVPAAELSGTVQNDVLKDYVARGTYIFPPGPSMKIAVDIFKFCGDNLPKWNTISISGYHIREAGSTAAQEVAFTFANGIEYVSAAVKAGLDIDNFAGRLSFFFNCHNNFFEEIAKFRAARRIWARIMKERFGARKESSWKLRFHSQTGGSTLTAQQPMNNIMRVAYQSLAAVLGGTQSLHTNSWDEALSLPSESSVKTALRTQQLIAAETGAADTADPLGGSYYVESLTDSLEGKINDYIAKIDKLGGAIRAIENRYIQGEIEDSSYTYQKEIEKLDRKILGVNCNTDKEKINYSLFKVNSAIESEQVAALRNLKASRKNEAVDAALKEIDSAVSLSANLMPPIIKAVSCYATIGEICAVLRKHYGEYQDRGL